MATRALLSDLSRAVQLHRSIAVDFRSFGGVEVARQIRAGTDADLTVLSSAALAGLEADGFLRVGTLKPLFVSDVVAAVPGTAGPVRLDTEQDLQAALAEADRIAYSTGPSGDALVALVDRLGLAEVVRPKLLQAPPGTPVGSLLADARADLGFQQRSELSDVQGVRVLGPLPGATAIQSMFSGAVLATSTDPGTAEEALRFFGSPEAHKQVTAAGMTPA